MRAEMRLRTLLALAACVAFAGCASSQSGRLNASTASSTVYGKKAVTPRSSTPAARRLPATPNANYRAPSVRPYSATPRARPLPATPAPRVITQPSIAGYGTGTYGRVPPPPPPPSNFGIAASRPLPVGTPVLAQRPIDAGNLLPPPAPMRTRSVTATRGVIAPTSRTVLPAPALPAAPAAPSAAELRRVTAPIAPIQGRSLLRGSGKRFKPASALGLGSLRPRGARACKT